MQEIDFEVSVADWAIDHPAAIAVFQELGIDYCCGGKSLRSACLQAGVGQQALESKLRRALSERTTTARLKATAALRPLSYWVEHHPPGWISRHDAFSADPIALAVEIHAKAKSFLDWLQLSHQARWDNYVLQALSAAVFNRYPVDKHDRSKQQPITIELLQLNWPAGSGEICYWLEELQRLLKPSFAVFKAVRSALSLPEFPTQEELLLADNELDTVGQELPRIVARLGAALDQYSTSDHNHQSVLQHR